jgi:F-type H+-transporting ATPase subunit gamma
MSNLKALKSRINSVKSTQKITKAMKMVAASRLRKAKKAVEASRPYADNIESMISDLASSISVRGTFSQDFSLLTGTGKEKTHLILILSSDRGLCGGLNSTTVRFAKKRVAQLESEGKNVKINCIGKKAYEQLKAEFEEKIVEKNFGIFKEEITYETATKFAQDIVAKYGEGQFDVCEVIYSKFKSAIAQELVNKRLIPASIKVDEFKKSEAKPANDFEMPIEYEPTQEEVLNNLLPRYVAMQIFNELLENSASEQGARMAAMEAATSNASKMIKDLSLVYNRTRQANITCELIDIISGANAV